MQENTTSVIGQVLRTKRMLHALTTDTCFYSFWYQIQREVLGSYQFLEELHKTHLAVALSAFHTFGSVSLLCYLPQIHWLFFPIYIFVSAVMFRLSKSKFGISNSKDSLAQYQTSLISKYQRCKIHSDHMQALPVSALHLRNTKRMLTKQLTTLPKEV